MAKEIKPPAGFEWLEEEPPKDKWMSWRKYPARIAAVVYPNEDPDKARRRVKAKVQRAIESGGITANGCGEKVRTLSFWRWVHKEYPSVPLPFHYHWIRQTVTSSMPLRWSNTENDCDEAIQAALAALPENLAYPLLAAVRRYQDKVSQLESKLAIALEERDNLMKFKENTKMRLREAGRKGGKMKKEW